MSFSYLQFALIALIVCVYPSPLLATSEECQKYNVTESLTLQRVIDQVLETKPDCTVIEMPPGNHTILSQTIFSTDLKHLEFRGHSNETLVFCDYGEMTNYTWYFDEIASLTIRNINFCNCPTPLRIDTVAEVQVFNSSFRYFSEAVLDIFNCHHTKLSRIVVEHNTGSGKSDDSFRGNTGGISFGIDNPPLTFNTLTLTVHDSQFRNNSATASFSFQNSDDAFYQDVFTGRGGALGVFVNTPVFVTISDCTFENNHARSYGGGIYILPGGESKIPHNITVQRCDILNNKADIGGGGVQVTYPRRGPAGSPHLVTFIHSNLTNNFAPLNGGGMFVITFKGGNRIDIKHCNFTGNGAEHGGALVLTSFTSLNNSSEHIMTDCTFHRNTGYGGAMSIWYVSLSLSGTNTLSSNTGTALQVVSSVIHLSGQLSFLNNTGRNGTALYMQSFSQAVLNPGLDIRFEGNTGMFGACIHVENQYNSPVVKSSPITCFLRHVDFKPPIEWDNITVTFSQNKAILASNLYMSRLDWEACSSSSFFYMYQSQMISLKDIDLDIREWPIWDIGLSNNTNNTNNNTGYCDPTLLELTVQTTAFRLTRPNVTAPDTPIIAWPGQNFTLELTGLDVYNTSTSTMARFDFKNKSNVEISFRPEILIIAPDPHTGLLNHIFNISYMLVGELPKNTTGILGNVSLQSLDSLNTELGSLTFMLKGQLCPAGYTLFTTTEYSIIDNPTNTITTTVCNCTEGIVPEILHCDSHHEIVIIQQGKWAVYVPMAEGTSNMRFYPCPPDYCSCTHRTHVKGNKCVYVYVQSDPDLQCTCGRKGILCGECSREGDGVSVLLNECVSCPSISALLIPVLVIADVVVLLVLTLCDFSLPSWTTPFIFYIQIASIVGRNFPYSFTQVGKYLYFIASASGFYFVYDFCLYEGLSSEVAYSLRYLPLLLSLLICIPVFILRTTRRISRHKVVSSHGVWSVVLLMYTSVVHTALSILNCHSISDSEGDSSYHWFVNGSRECFAHSHIFIALISIVVLLAAGVLIVFCVVVSICHTDKLRQWLKPMQGALILHYRQSYRWWSAIDLTRRFIILLFITLFPSNTVVPILLLAIYTTVYTFVQPYKSKLTNKLESVVNVNFLFLLILNATAFFHEDYFTFPDHTQTQNETINCSQSVRGVATLSWILMPFYYLPLLFFCFLISVQFLHHVRRQRLKTRVYEWLRPRFIRWWFSGRSRKTTLLSEGTDSNKRTAVYTMWDMEMSSNGFIHMHAKPQNDNESIE